MDVNFWAARVNRHSPSVQSAGATNSGTNTFTEEGGNEVTAWFPCPFCYVEIELPLLCVHLQEEHCFDLKNAVCPICVADLGKDPLVHFTMQHAHSMKHMKKSQKSGNMMIKDLRDLSSFMGANSLSSKGNGNEPPHDPLISPFLCNVPLDIGGREHLSTHVLATVEDESKVSEEGSEEKMQQSAFIQELLLSTIF